jgi:hypothetical protein
LGFLFAEDDDKNNIRLDTWRERKPNKPFPILSTENGKKPTPEARQSRRHLFQTYNNQEASVFTWAMTLVKALGTEI